MALHQLTSFTLGVPNLDEGTVPAGVGFQVEYPTPFASISAYIVPEQQTLLPAYERAMFADIDRLLAAIPHHEVAVQWDVAVEFFLLEEAFAPLAELAVGPETELNFGLVPYHPADQAPGITGDQVQLIDAALAASPVGGRDWGACTECGMGRAERGDIPVLLDLHRQILATAAH